MIKLISSDIDGTLVNNNKEFSPDFGEILEALEKKNVKFVAASGRSKYAIERIFKQFPTEIFYISDNGAFVSDNKQEYFTHKMSREEIDKVMELLLPIKGIQIILCGKEKAYFVNLNPELLEDVVVYYDVYEIVDDYRTIKDDILKMAVYDSLGSAKNAHPKIKDYLPENLCSVVSSDVWLDVMDKSVTKGVGLEILQQKLGISYDETMAFGDFFNDVEMLKKAKYSFAMANASDEIKSCCNYTAPDNDSFGVSAMIKKYVFKKD